MAGALDKLLSVGPDAGGEEMGGGSDSSELDAAKDILAAIARKDPRALSLALKRHYEACEGSDDETEEDDYGDED